MESRYYIQKDNDDSGGHLHRGFRGASPQPPSFFLTAVRKGSRFRFRMPEIKDWRSISLLHTKFGYRVAKRFLGGILRRYPCTSNPPRFLQVIHRTRYQSPIPNL